MSESTPFAGLHCLGGAEAPDELIRDLAPLALLPLPALDHVGALVDATLGDDLPSDLGPAIEAIALACKIDARGLTRAVTACRFIVRSAAQHDIEPRALARDLDAIGRTSGLDLAPLLVGRYTEARAELRQDALARSLAEHGALLEGVSWRRDQVKASRHASGFSFDVGLLTLRYRSGARSKQLTLYVPPAVLAELTDACDRLR